MNPKQTSDFILGIAGNLVASLIIALANIFFGRFAPNTPREFLDVASLVFPFVFIFMFLYKDKIGKIRFNPRLKFLHIRKSLTHAPLTKQVKQFFQSFINGVKEFVSQLLESGRQTKNWANYLERAIKPSVIIVTVITVFLIVSFGVSIRWLYEQRTITTTPSVYSSYQHIYDFLAPQNDTP
mgnify:CR=1 FL=1|jgi:hypothetical protein